jgi:hypothetical protein
VATLALVGGLPYYELSSVSRVQDSLLTTRYFEPDLYLRQDYAVQFDGKEHVAIPRNKNNGKTISLSGKSFTLELWVRHDRSIYLYSCEVDDGKCRCAARRIYLQTLVF